MNYQDILTALKNGKAANDVAVIRVRNPYLIFENSSGSVTFTFDKNSELTQISIELTTPLDTPGNYEAG